MSPSPVDSTEASETNRLLDDNFFIFFLKCGSRSNWRGKTLGFLRRRWREPDEVEEERKSLRLEFLSLENVNCCRVRPLNTFPVINMSTAGEDRGFRQLFVCLRKKAVEFRLLCKWLRGCSGDCLQASGENPSRTTYPIELCEIKYEMKFILQVRFNEVIIHKCAFFFFSFFFF